ncbi:MAG: redox-sensing transcriptional repressor Rex [Chitinivibrionales bacterium]
MIYRRNHVTRISMYKSVVKRMRALGMNKVFSENIADALGLTAAQVRKDFSTFGITGRKRAGYSIEELLSDLNTLLGKDSVRDAVVAGYGSLGRAVSGYMGFEREMIRIRAVFERDEKRLVREADIPVLPVDEMEKYISENGIRLGIIAVPDEAAQGVLDRFVSSGIKGVMNFASGPLRVPENIVVHDIDLNLAMETLTFYVFSGCRVSGEDCKIRGRGQEV